MAKLTLRDLDVRGERVLVRADFNVPTEMRGGKFPAEVRVQKLLSCT